VLVNLLGDKLVFEIFITFSSQPVFFVCLRLFILLTFSVVIACVIVLLSHKNVDTLNCGENLAKLEGAQLLLVYTNLI